MVFLYKKGFTLVELLVSISIFVMITALLLVNSGGFNNAIILTNMAYDTAITIREAQNYALSVRPMTSGTDEFAGRYGVFFSESTSNDSNITFYLFEDTNYNSVYDSGVDMIISTRKLKRGNYVSDVCLGTSSADCQTPTTPIDSGISLIFKRPSPLVFMDNDSTKTYAQITISNPDNSDSRKIVVRQNGQIEIEE